jgi:hypothetical protein
LLLAGISVAAQTTTSISDIPNQVKQNATNKAVTKSNTVSNNALNKMDSSADKAFKGFTNMFKKKHNAKNKNPQQDSSKVNVTDTTNMQPKPGSGFIEKKSFYFVACGEKIVANDDAFEYLYRNKMKEYLMED